MTAESIRKRVASCVGGLSEVSFLCVLESSSFRSVVEDVHFHTRSAPVLSSGVRAASVVETTPDTRPTETNKTTNVGESGRLLQHGQTKDNARTRSSDEVYQRPERHGLSLSTLPFLSASQVPKL